MKEDVVDKPRLIRGGVHIDDRGAVTFCNDFDMSEIKRFYMLENYEQGYVRAWHGHIKEAKWVVCVSGVAVEAAVEMFNRGNRGEYELHTEKSCVTRHVLHPNGDVLYIPSGYANGHKNLTLGTRLIHFSNLAQDETVGDDVRFDSSIHGWVWEVKSR